jgi:hypothetical protein
VEPVALHVDWVPALPVFVPVVPRRSCVMEHASMLLWTLIIAAPVARHVQWEASVSRAPVLAQRGRPIAETPVPSSAQMFCIAAHVETTAPRTRHAQMGRVPALLLWSIAGIPVPIFRRIFRIVVRVEMTATSMNNASQEIVSLSRVRPTKSLVLAPALTLQPTPRIVAHVEINALRLQRALPETVRVRSGKSSVVTHVSIRPQTSQIVAGAIIAVDRAKPV